jgi:hypothetical protein
METNRYKLLRTDPNRHSITVKSDRQKGSFRIFKGVLLPRLPGKKRRGYYYRVYQRFFLAKGTTTASTREFSESSQVGLAGRRSSRCRGTTTASTWQLPVVPSSSKRRVTGKLFRVFLSAKVYEHSSLRSSPLRAAMVAVLGASAHMLCKNINMLPHAII